MITALDLFAGTGWGVACRSLGIREMGVEIMPEACATREANGMATLFHDVWEGLENNLYIPDYQLLIASPPCQTFSMAGHGTGRDALTHVLAAIEARAYKDPDRLREFGVAHDDRTALVLTPLSYVWRDRPRFVAMEQVPTVLPVWEACAEAMRAWGYHVWTGNLQAEQYGVPQTRKRAFLLASLDGPVTPPAPTHSRYYSRTPERLDAGVRPWVSMAEALGWGATDQPSHTVTAGTQSYPGMLRSNYGTGGDASKRGERLTDQLAPTLTSKADRNKWDGVRKMSVDEAAILQTYPAMQWCGTKSKQFLQIGNAVPPLLARAVLSELTAAAA